MTRHASRYSQVQLLDALVGAAADGDGDAERSLRKLVGLTRAMERLIDRAEVGVYDEIADDEARAIRSQLRMWGQQGRMEMEGAWVQWLRNLGQGP